MVGSDCFSLHNAHGQALRSSEGEYLRLESSLHVMMMSRLDRSMATGVRFMMLGLSHGVRLDQIGSK